MSLKFNGTYLYLELSGRANYDILKSGNKFSMDDMLFLTDFRISSDALAYHFMTWKTCCPDIRDYGFVTSCYPVAPRLAFNSESSKVSFVSWWENLGSHFPEGFKKEAHCYPQLPENEVVTGTIVPCTERNKTWVWIIAKCKGNVWFLDNRLLFESDSDVVMYKMDFLHKDG
jgi:hypothetical protein